MNEFHVQSWCTIFFIIEYLVRFKLTTDGRDGFSCFIIKEDKQTDPKSQENLWENKWHMDVSCTTPLHHVCIYTKIPLERELSANFAHLWKMNGQKGKYAYALQ